MELPKTRRILNVFLASPNDVAEERTIAEEVVTDFNKETYFYNVVYWLDKILYAPSPLRELFLRELEQAL